jgi:hypothetical protein
MDVCEQGQVPDDGQGVAKRISQRAGPHPMISSTSNPVEVWKNQDEVEHGPVGQGVATVDRRRAGTHPTGSHQFYL